MRAHGLFIGIDRYRSPLVTELSCAVRDAHALFALFVDTFGRESGIVITDHSATKSEVIEQFRVLAAAAGEDDLVFIAYAGHGSDDFYLLTHEADPADFSSTAIALDELVDLFAQIPSKRAMLVLDCCFSGGAGARVFQHAFATRNLESVEQALARIGDDGRIILTACDHTQEAIEDPVEGHGMLTRHLLDALRGPPEIVQHERIGIYDLLAYVTQRVTDGAAALGHEQRPTFRGKVDGELKLPVFVPGAEYAKRFPGAVAPPVTSELSDLVVHGIPDLLVDALRATIPSLNQLQIDAINKYGVLAGRSVLVSAPTSSGKTLIGELAALRGATNRRRALFLLPLKALVADKHADLTRKYGQAGLRILRATGDMHDDVPALLRGQYDICLMTYEKAAALLLSSPHVLRGIGLIVVDEVQMLADKSRGAGLEFLLTLVRHRHRVGMRPQLVLLSAVIGDTHGLERWIGGGLLRSDTRPVPLMNAPDEAADQAATNRLSYFRPTLRTSGWRSCLKRTLAGQTGLAVVDHAHADRGAGSSVGGDLLHQKFPGVHKCGTTHPVPIAELSNQRGVTELQDDADRNEVTQRRAIAVKESLLNAVQARSAYSHGP